MQPGEYKKEVERLLRSGQKLQAIKYLSETFQVSLVDAKALVEAAEREIELNTSSPTATDYSESRNAVLAKVEQLLRGNKKLEAVKHAQVSLKIGLREALTLVEGVEQKVNPEFIPMRMARGCAGQAKVAALIFGGIGIMFVVIAFIIYNNQQRIISNSEQMIGRVIELRTDDSESFAPVIAYTWQGKEMQYVDNVYSNPPTHEVGEEVNIFVNRDNPHEIVIDSYLDRWLLIHIIGGIGVVFIGVTVLFVFISRKF